MTVVFPRHTDSGEKIEHVVQCRAARSTRGDDNKKSSIARLAQGAIVTLGLWTPFFIRVDGTELCDGMEGFDSSNRTKSPDLEDEEEYEGEEKVEYTTVGLLVWDVTAGGFVIVGGEGVYSLASWGSEIEGEGI